MDEMTIGQARDSLSTVISRLRDGSISECVIKDRSTPVARIVPFTPKVEMSKRPFGIARDQPFLIDDELFDALDAEISTEFGL